MPSEVQRVGTRQSGFENEIHPKYTLRIRYEAREWHQADAHRHPIGSNRVSLSEGHASVQRVEFASSLRNILI